MVCAAFFRLCKRQDKRLLNKSTIHVWTLTFQFIKILMCFYLSVCLSICLSVFAEKYAAKHFDRCSSNFIWFPFFFSSTILNKYFLESPQKNSLQNTFKDRIKNFIFSSTLYYYLSESCYPPPCHPCRCLHQIKTFTLEWLPRETGFNMIMLFMCQLVQLPANSCVTWQAGKDA